MSLDYFRCYHSYRKKLANLSDEEIGRLFRELMEYSETGKRNGFDSIAFDFIAEDIDKDKAEHERLSKKRQDSGRLGGLAKASKSSKPKQRLANLANARNGVSVEAQQVYGFGEELENVFRDWLEYKKEKHQSYKSKGLEALVTQVRKYSTEYGEQAVADLIRQSMANGWQGIVWNRIEVGPSIPQRGKSAGGNIFLEMLREEEEKERMREQD